MEFSGPIVELMKLISPDGKSFDMKKFQEAAAAFKAEDAKLAAQLEAPTTSTRERIDDATAALRALEPFEDSAARRNVDTVAGMQNIRNNAFGSQLQDVTNANLQILQPAYGSLTEGRQMQSADYGKLLEYNASQRNADRDLKRELMNKRNTMGLIKSGIGGGLLLLDILKGN